MVESAFTTGSDLEFPKLMVRKNGNIVFFRYDGVGQVVYSPEPSQNGEFSSQWPMDEFKDLPSGSTVTITQE